MRLKQLDVRLVSAVMVLLNPYPALAEPFVSVFSNHEYAKCNAVTGEAKAFVCESPVNIPVKFTDEQGKGFITLGEKPLAGDAMPGFGAYKAGPTIEWRGIKANDALRPVGAIVRYAVGAKPEALTGNAFVVYRLQPDGVSCVMGVIGIEAPNAGLKAREFVDKTAETFVCGTSKAKL